MVNFGEAFENERFSQNSMRKCHTVAPECFGRFNKWWSK